VEEIEAWLEFLTRRKMDENGTLSWLSATDWRKRRQDLRAATAPIASPRAD
jgi:hypothetical protein